jgi:hypothetical protein
MHSRPSAQGVRRDDYALSGSRRPQGRGGAALAIERTSGTPSVIDVLDRVLVKVSVIDALVRVSLVGIDLVTVQARVIVASFDTYLKYADSVSEIATASQPAVVDAVPRRHIPRAA